MHGGPPGDLYVVLRVEEDKTFARQGQDLIYTATISFPQAALGVRIEVPGLDETLDLEIPKERRAVPYSAWRQRPAVSRRKTGRRLAGGSAGANAHQLNEEQERLLREFEKITRAQEKTLSGKVKKAMHKFGKAMGMD